jgi:predicted transcriptional regulator of viral defense system
MTHHRPDSQCLFRVASQQSGHFTAAQAYQCGYSRSLLSHHVKTGELLRIRYGLYRLRDYPSAPREDVIAAWLAAGSEDAVVSHESALEMLGLSDVVPNSIHLTIPRHRRGFRTPPGVTVHLTRHPPDRDEIEIREGVRVTNPARSIVDAAEAGTSPDQIVRAIRDARSRGMATAKQIAGAMQGRTRRVRDLIGRELGSAW